MDGRIAALCTVCDTLFGALCLRQFCRPMPSGPHWAGRAICGLCFVFSRAALQFLFCAVVIK